MHSTMNNDQINRSNVMIVNPLYYPRSTGLSARIRVHRAHTHMHTEVVAYYVPGHKKVIAKLSKMKLAYRRLIDSCWSTIFKLTALIIMHLRSKHLL
jgi:hypothetical protein